MKSIIKRTGMAFAAILTLCFSTTLVFAGKEINVPGVVQGTDGNTFAKDAPVVSILFDKDLISHEKNAELKFLNKEEYPGFVALTAEKDNMPGWNPERDSGHTFVVYDERVQGAKALAVNDMNTFYGDIFSYTYKNAAILDDKTRAHIVITYSNISIPLQTNLGKSQAANYSNLSGWEDNNGTGERIADDYFLIAAGDYIRTGNSITKDNAGSGVASATTTRNGLKADVKIQVVDDSGTAIQGTFAFVMKDLDVKRSGANSFEKIYNAAQNNNYSENIRINSGLAANSAIYIPDAAGIDDNSTEAQKEVFKGYRCNVEKDEEGRYLFKADISDSPDPGTCYSGFITVIDNASGLDITVWSTGLSDNCVRTWLLDRDGSYFETIQHTNSTGGTIKTTELGNESGNLDDGSTVLDSDEYVVTNGKTIVYTIEANEGYNMNFVTVDGQQIIPPPVGESIEVTLSNGEKGIFKNIGEGIYTFTFVATRDPHILRASWQADRYFKKLWIGEDGESIALNAKAYVFNGTSFEPAANIADVGFSINKSDVFSRAEFDGKIEWVIKKTDLAAELESTVPGEPPIPLYWFVTEQVPEGYSGSYDNSSVAALETYTTSEWEKAVKNAPNGAYASISANNGGTIINGKMDTLVIQKQVKGLNAETDRNFDMEIELKLGGGAYNPEILPNGFIQAENGKYYFQLKHDERVEITIPVGTSYIITEADTEYEQSYEILKADGSTIKSSANEEEALIGFNGNQTFKLINTKPMLSEIVNTGDDGILIPVAVAGISLSLVLMLALLIWQRQKE